MEKKEKQSGSQLLPVLLVCMLLACAGLVFAVYTHKEFSWLKTQIHEHEKLIQILQLSNNARDIQGSEEVRIRRSAQTSCNCVGAPGRPGQRGRPGKPGHVGPRGTPGFPGMRGFPGMPGEPGPVGPPGVPGARGFQGPVGPPGPPGLVQGTNKHKLLRIPGDPGPMGPPGPPGFPGLKGSQGMPGDPGRVGPPGFPGLRGSRGSIGFPGAPGSQGMPGEPGPVGPPGPPGFPGPAGMPGPQGIKGNRGETGDRGVSGTIRKHNWSGLPRERGLAGPPGPPGYPGPAGIPGPPGLTGSPGLDGFPGIPGPPGMPGPVGSPGPPGPAGLLGSASHDSIHLIGNGLKIRQVHSQRVGNWTLKHRAGSILYNPSSGHIQVKKAGYYFIYSQMLYYDRSSTYMAHATFINDNKVMGSIGSVINSKKFLDTKFHGGVFSLRENDTISVHVSDQSTYYMSFGESYFGAFWIGDPGTPDSNKDIPPISF